MDLQAKAPEKKKRKKRVKRSSSPPRTPPSYSLLPDEIMENCLARVPRSYYPKLSQVSKSFRSILSSSDLYAARSRLGNTQQCLYVCLEGENSRKNKYLQWISFSINPNRTKKKYTIGQFPVPVPFSSFATSANPSVVGSEIYVFGGYNEPCSFVRVLDCLSHTWRESPSMIVPRENPWSCVYNGKIYVFGGIDTNLFGGESWGEVFDIKTQTWERLPEPGCEIPKCYVYRIAELEGKIYFRNEFGKTMHAYYDTKQCKWQKSATLPWPECVIDTVSYSFRWHNIAGQYNLCWRNTNGGPFRVVKGLVSLANRYKRHCGSRDTRTITTSYGGKVYVMWEGYPKKNNPNQKVNICCTEISVEKRNGNEIWGNVEWLDVVHTFPTPHSLLHCLAISL